jgi:hypothetical protein
VGTANGSTTLIRLGTNEGAIIFEGTIRTAFNAGEVRSFAIDDPNLMVIVPLNFPKETPTITVQRANSMIGSVSWFNLSMRLLDGNGHLLQEISDFVDSDTTETFIIPRDGESHEIFCFCAQANRETIQWLAHYNPRAPQIRRNTFEHAPLLNLTDAFARHFAPWQVNFFNAPYDIHFSGFWGDGATTAVLYDLPGEVYSIGTLTHVPLTPFSYDPAYAVGNSLACPFIPLNAACCHFPSAIDAWKNHAYFRQSMLFDYSYLLNEAFYDHYFVSGFHKFVDGVPQFFTTCRPFKSIDEFSDCTLIAQELFIEGAFNVNCASVETWKLLLRSMPYDSEEHAYYLPNSAGQTSFGSKFQRRHFLSENDLDRLAECIVEEIKTHGPFPTLSAFINRKLSNADGEAARSGLIQRAISRAKINESLEKNSSETADRREGDWFDESLANGSVNAQSPAFITQADFLQFFGNQFVVRSDTFSIRAYGDSINPSGGDILAKAMCETIVQRMPDGTLQVKSFRWVP